MLPRSPTRPPQAHTQTTHLERACPTCPTRFEDRSRRSLIVRGHATWRARSATPTTRTTTAFLSRWMDVTPAHGHAVAAAHTPKTREARMHIQRITEFWYPSSHSLYQQLRRQRRPHRPNHGQLKTFRATTRTLAPCGDPVGPPQSHGLALPGRRTASLILGRLHSESPRCAQALANRKLVPTSTLYAFGALRTRWVEPRARLAGEGNPHQPSARQPSTDGVAAIPGEPAAALAQAVRCATIYR